MYSPQKAAVIAGVSRKTVMDAINAKKLNATRSNRNYWVISTVDLKAWMDSRGVKPKPDTSSDAFSDTSSDTITQLTVKNRTLEVQLKASADTIIDLRETNADLKIQRESWKAQAIQLLKHMCSKNVEDKIPPLILTSAHKPQKDTAPEPQN